MPLVPAVLLATLSAVVSPCALPASARADDGAVVAAPRLDPLIVRALRDSRRKDGPQHEDVVATIVKRGPQALDFLLDVLIARQVPTVEAEEKPQILSVPQREMILDALSHLSPTAVCNVAEARLREIPTTSFTPDALAQQRLQVRCAVIYAYSAAGTARDLTRVFELALAPEETTVEDSLAAALQCATERILRRDPAGFAWLRSQMEHARTELGSHIVFAVGATRDPRALPLLVDLLTFHGELAPVILSQARLLGRSTEIEVNHSFASRAANYLDPDRGELAASAARIVGELGHDDSVPRLIELLSGDSASLRDSALWGLQRLSRLDYPAQPRLWQRWYDNEQAFWVKQAPKAFEELIRGNSARKLIALADLSARTLHRDEYAQAIAGALRHSDVEFGKQACSALASLRSVVVVPQLVDALEDPNPAVAAAVHAALEAITGRSLPTDAENARIELRL